MERLKRNTLSILVYFVIIIAALGICYVLVYGSGGIISRQGLEKRIAGLQEEVSLLKEEIDLADLDLENLKDNRTYIEGFARELGYKKEGEVIYKFIERKE